MITAKNIKKLVLPDEDYCNPLVATAPTAPAYVMHKAYMSELVGVVGAC